MLELQLQKCGPSLLLARRAYLTAAFLGMVLYLSEAYGLVF